MSLVLDASAALAWVYEEQSALDLDRLFDALMDSGAWVPQLWHLEIANVLLTGVRKKRHDMDTVFECLETLSSVQITVDEQTGSLAWDRVLELAVLHGLTTYDACYLDLAMRLSLPLATLDRQLQTAAKKEEVALFWSIASS